jgi:hypothetical protein
LEVFGYAALVAADAREAKMRDQFKPQAIESQTREQHGNRACG